MYTQETALAAWKMAVKNRNITKGLIFHLDRGVQYTSEKFTNCRDNEEAESFFKTLKTEQIYGNKLITNEQTNSIYLNT